MNLKLQTNTQNIGWNQVVDILKQVNMGYHAAEIHEKAFNNSHVVAFIFDNECLIGFGRALSDGAYQAAIYDVAVHPNYQGKGIGKMILESIMQQCPDCNFILYASPGKELFYQKMQFRRMKSGMALFTNSIAMAKKGFTD